MAGGWRFPPAGEAIVGEVIEFHSAASDDLKNASIGTVPADNSLSRFAKPREASLRPAKMLRKCHSEQPADSAIREMGTLLAAAQRRIGWLSDMARIISTRNNECQSEIFPAEMAIGSNGLLNCPMGKKSKPKLFQIYLGEWLEFLDLDVGEAAKIAGCDQSYISNIKRGTKSHVNVLYLLALTEDQGITVNDLYRKPPTKLQQAHLQEYSPQAQALILGRVRRKPKTDIPA